MSANESVGVPLVGFSDQGWRPHLTLVQSPAALPASRRPRQERIGVRLTFSELVLIHKALQAVKTLGALPPQDELLNDTMQAIDVTLNEVVKLKPPRS